MSAGRLAARGPPSCPGSWPPCWLPGRQPSLQPWDLSGSPDLLAPVPAAEQCFQCAAVCSPPPLVGGKLRGEDADSEQGENREAGQGSSGQKWEGVAVKGPGVLGRGSSLCPQCPSVQTFQGPFSAVPTWVGRRGSGSRLGAWAWQRKARCWPRWLGCQGLGNPASGARVPVWTGLTSGHMTGASEQRSRGARPQVDAAWSAVTDTL